MALPEDHPLYQMSARLWKALEQIEQFDRIHAEFKRHVRRTEFPSRAHAREAWTMLSQQRRMLQKLITVYEDALAEHNAIWQAAWEKQKRAWLDQADEDLTQLWREHHT